jgi:hypothetical protein
MKLNRKQKKIIKDRFEIWAKAVRTSNIFDSLTDSEKAKLLVTLGQVRHIAEGVQYEEQLDEFAKLVNLGLIILNGKMPYSEFIQFLKTAKVPNVDMVTETVYNEALKAISNNVVLLDFIRKTSDFLVDTISEVKNARTIENKS